MAITSKVQLAILDDYQAIAESKFDKLKSRIDVSNFPETLDANDSEQKKALIERLQPFAVVCTMRERTVFPADVISALPNLRLLLTTGMKNVAIDIRACSEQGVTVVGAKGKAPTALDSTMQHTWALILGLARNIAWDDAVIKSGGWQSSFAIGLKGKTLGVLGLGKLGADTARVGSLAFGMNILAWSSSLTQEGADEKAKAFGLSKGTFKVAQSKDELFQKADILSIHYVLSSRSKGIVGAEDLAILKRTAMLINTSRAGLVEEDALLSTLQAGEIRGAALDVYDTEPLPMNSAWRRTKWGEGGTSHVLLSPHMGYVEEAVMHAWYDETVANVEKWLDGHDIATKLN